MITPIAKDNTLSTLYSLYMRRVCTSNGRAERARALQARGSHKQCMLEHNRAIFREVLRNQNVSNYYLLVLYTSEACSNTPSVGFLDSGTHEQRSPSAFEHPGSPRALEKGCLSTLKRLGGLEHTRTGVHEHTSAFWPLERARIRSSMLKYARLCSIMLDYARLCSSRASTVVPLLEHAEHSPLVGRGFGGGGVGGRAV